jgi:hypothetical protein
MNECLQSTWCLKHLDHQQMEAVAIIVVTGTIMGILPHQ